MPKGTWVVGLAADLAVVVVTDRAEGLVSRGDDALDVIEVWLKLNHLELAPEIPEAVILKGKIDRRNIKFELRDAQIEPKKHVKYLGILIDDKGAFGEPIKQTIKKVEANVASLTRIMPNIKGPKSRKKQVLYNVTKSILTYGAPIWHMAIGIKRCKQMLISTQKKALLRVISRYRTIFASAIQIVVGILPIDLIDERRRLYEGEDGGTPQAKKVEKEISLERCQTQWYETIGVDKNTYTQCEEMGQVSA
ncbi:hypothetical protein NQ314_007878 [Rhamnusium bicolor]|uniref:Reverse transcriptase domain-containing protein n=1 Tax=Rhamnusium bicolor TaxID=1586634 RepID=A0AAV8YJ14_9CUCU|nr:hypothetical protein NQ314_007878 [Rhamnusium bicolor]